MSINSNLHAAKRAKMDEFYTRFEDITAEVLRYDVSQWRGKTVLLPCDDPETSNFTKFFALKFEALGLKKLITTSYNEGGRGKVFTLETDTDDNGIIDPRDIQWTWLEGDGDFRSDEVKALRDEADIIVTNPPFSLFREFLAWIVEADKQFLLLGNPNAITYKDVWPLIQADKMWWGVKSSGGVNMFFNVPDWYANNLEATKPEGSWWQRIDGKVCAGIKTVWFTNLDHGRRHEWLQLATVAENLRFNKVFTDKTAYDRYDNYDAIEVPKVLTIPSDYEGVMGVPITFLDKYCPEQFEILGMSASWWEDTADLRTSDTHRHGPFINDSEIYRRIFIKHRNTNTDRNNA